MNFLKIAIGTLIAAGLVAGIVQAKPKVDAKSFYDNLDRQTGGGEGAGG